MKRKPTNADLARTLPRVQQLLDDVTNDINMGGKNEVIILRVSSEEKERIKSKAMKAGYGVSAYIRDVILERIATVKIL